MLPEISLMRLLVGFSGSSLSFYTPLCVPLRPLWFKTQQQPAADELDKIQSDVATHLIFWFVAVISSINKPLRRFFFLATR